MKSLLLSLLFVCQLSFADSIYIGGFSEHLGTHMKVTNNVHHLVAIEHETLFVGVYKNSYDDWTTVVAKRLEFMESPNWKAAVNVGIVHGYHKCFRVKSTYKITCVAAIPELTYTKYKVQPTLVLLGDAVGLTFKVEF